ncbi:hypothetical protein TNCV_1910831 [Trichonephila clavipes]|nr:hypothetical protein TNCV_1910831 [Trichonephila clavipes]
MLRPTTCVHLVPSHDEFSRPRSDFVRQVALATTQQIQRAVSLYVRSLQEHQGRDPQHSGHEFATLTTRPW